MTIDDMIDDSFERFSKFLFYVPDDPNYFKVIPLPELAHQQSINIDLRHTNLSAPRSINDERIIKRI